MRGQTFADIQAKALMDSGRPLQIVTTCRARDLPIFEITSRKIEENIPCFRLHVIAPEEDCRKIRRRIGPRAQVTAEDGFIPGMTIGQLRTLDVEGFPKAAGWYFQQLLKLQFAFNEPEIDFYLIWDADTIPLRPLRFFDSAGRMLLTKATEHHPHYFETYRRLLREEPIRQFSFISQHMIVQKSVAREMLRRIDQNLSGDGGWAWKIMRSLPRAGLNLFSEYETYGHYVKNHYPDRVVFLERPWLREGTQRVGGGIPSDQDLEIFARDFEFVAFERANKGWRRFAKFVLEKMRKF